MRNYHIDEPYEIGGARHQYDNELFIKASDIDSILRTARAVILFDENASKEEISACKDKLMYVFCEATQAYCSIMSDLQNEQRLPNSTKHYMEVSVRMIEEKAKEALDLMEKVQEKQSPQDWYSEYIKFGQWFYKNDQNVDPLELAATALKSVGNAMDKINEKEEIERNGITYDDDKFGEICQKFGEGKTIIESCLLPAAIYKKDIASTHIFQTAMNGFIYTYINKNNLESHLTPRGFMFAQQDGLNQKEKNYFLRAFNVIRTLTSKNEGVKVMQKESNMGTQAQINIETKKGKLTATANYTKGIHTQYDPNATEMKQAVQKTVSTLGSILDVIKDAEKVATGKIVGMAANTLSLQFDRNVNTMGDEIKGKPSEITSTLPQKPEMQYNADGTEDKTKYMKDLNKEHLTMLAELTKLAIRNSDIDIGEHDISEYMDLLDNISTIGSAAYNISLDQIGDAKLLSAFSSLTDLIYEYQSIDKLPKVDVEANKLAKHCREAIEHVVQITEKTYWEEYNKEQEWLRSEHGQYYLDAKEARDYVDRKCGIEQTQIEEEVVYTPGTRE